MADRVSASIVLGGTIDTAAFAELVALIELEGLSIEWDGGPFQPSDIIAGESLHLCAHEVAWGRLDHLENWCVARSVPFCRRSGAYGGEWNAERVVFTGSDAPRSFPADVDDHVVIDINTVTRLGSMGAIYAYFDAADFVVPQLAIEEPS